MFEEDSFLNKVFPYILGAALLVPMILLYVALKNAGIYVFDDSSDTTPITLFVGGILSVVAFVLFYITGQYPSAFWMWVGFGALVLGFLLGMLNTEAYYLTDYVFKNATERWFFIFAFTSVGIAAYALVPLYLSEMEIISQFLANIIDLAIIAVTFTVVAIFVFTDSFEALKVVGIIFAIPCVLWIIAEIVNYFKERA